MKTSKLQIKFTLIIGLTVTVIFALVIMFISIRATNIVKEDALKATEVQGTSYAEFIVDFIDEGLSLSRSLAKTVEAYRAVPSDSRRDVYAQFAKKALELNESFKSVWVALEPNVFNNDANYKNKAFSNDKGRYVAIWYRDGDKILSSMATEDEMLAAEFYQLPKNKKKEVIIEPYKYKFSENGKEYNITSVCAPIYDAKGNVLGVAGVDIDLSELQNFITREKQIMAVFSNEGAVVAHFDPSRIGKKLVETEQDMLGKDNVLVMAENIKQGKTYSLEFFAAAMNAQAYIVISPVRIGNTEQPWGFGYAIPLNEAIAKARALEMVVITIAFVGLLLLLVVLFILIRGISKPIVEVAAYAGRIAKGDLTSTINVNRNDEIGDMVNSLQGMGEKLSEIITNITAGAMNVASASSEFSSTTIQIAQGANEQASSAEEVSSSVEEMNSTIQQNTENAIQTERIASSAAQGILDVSTAAQKSLDATKQIAEKIQIINAIAEKTDILAINAAIEAARAGEHGKGFAVVAAEVRKLAETSQRAAVEINSLSSTSLQVTQEAGALMMKIIPEVQKTATLVQEIAAASTEQASGAIQITKAIEQLSQVTQQNSAAAEEMSSTAEELTSQADALQEAISFFNTGKEIKVQEIKVSKKEHKQGVMHAPKAINKGVNILTHDAKDKEFDMY